MSHQREAMRFESQRAGYLQGTVNSLPSAAEVERRFNWQSSNPMDWNSGAASNTANTSFKVLAQGGLLPFVTPC